MTTPERFIPVPAQVTDQGAFGRRIDLAAPTCPCGEWGPLNADGLCVKCWRVHAALAVFLGARAGALQTNDNETKGP